MNGQGLRVTCHPIRLPFRFPFTTSKGTKTHQPSLLVRVECGGVIGWGEAPAIHYYGVSVDQMVASLTSRRAELEAHEFTDPERFWTFAQGLFPDQSFLVCALDMAGWDLHGKREGKPLSTLWGGNVGLGPVSDYTIGMDTISRMVDKLREHPWPVYKIKVGGPEDMAVLRALRAHTEAPFRVDANAGWSLDQARAILPVLPDLGVELVEQPLAKEDLEGMQQLMAVSTLPLMADESCVGEQDVARCHGAFHGINIKLTKCGGITPALRMIRDARSRGMQVMIGSMSESSVGSAAIAHVSSLVDFLDNDGPLLLAEDVAEGLHFIDGRSVTSGLPGLGVTVHRFA